MADIQLVDVSLRDGNQSLWGATGLRTAHVAQVGPLMNRAGFRALDYSSSTAMGVSVRVHREDPWALLRMTRHLQGDCNRQFPVFTGQLHDALAHPAAGAVDGNDGFHCRFPVSSMPLHSGPRSSCSCCNAVALMRTPRSL